MSSNQQDTPIRRILLTIDSQLENVVLVAMAIRGISAFLSVSEKDINRMELAVVEVVNNAIEHAYGYDQNQKVEIEVSLETDHQVLFNVMDYGIRMDAVQEKSVTEVGQEEISGRGLAIVYRIMDCVDYIVSEDKNCFRMVYKLEK